MANIGDALAKGQQAIGAVEGIRSVLPPGLVPPALSGALDKLLGKGPSSSGAKSLNEFRSNFLYRKSVMRNNRYYVQINGTPSALAKDSATLQMIPFVAESASIPGVQLATSEIRRYGVGQVEKKPYSAVFVDTSMNFIVDGGGDIHAFFYNWINSIVRFDKGMTEIPTGLEPYEVEYKYAPGGSQRNYSTDISIFTLDEANRSIVEIKLIDAYPIFMGDMSLGWANTNDYAKLPVTFTYTRWTSERTPLTGIEKGPGASPLQKLLSLGSAVQSLAAIRKPTGVGDLLNIVNNSSSAVRGIKQLF